MFRNYLIRVENQYKEKISDRFKRRTIRLKNDKAFVSFTFDDFPRSAFLCGGKLLDKYQIKASYYASLGLLGRKTVVGDIFTSQDIKDMVDAGHEIGSHTFDHLNPWQARADVFEDSLVRNQMAMFKIIPGYEFKTMAYPYTQPHPRIKKVAGDHFSCCRGGGHISNIGRIDLNLLKSYFIDRRHREDLQYFVELLHWNKRDRGWLIFSTHDISENPSPFGCRPEFFESIIREAVASSSTILPICQVYSNIVASGT